MKLFKYVNQEEPITYLNTDVQVEIPLKYEQKELRGLWVSNVVNIDMPTCVDMEAYKSRIILLMETCVSYNINAIFFQVRTTNDAFYKSDLNPYSRFFTGTEGTEPSFDVLAWIIEQAKAHNVAFHAWCNPYRVSMNGDVGIEEYLASCDDLNFAKKHPEYLVLDTKGKLILNPTLDPVKQFVIDSMKELATNYDIDGIHFDDYFYPYSGLSETHNDLIQYEAVKDEMSLGDFRRNAVNDVIRGVYNAVKEVDSTIQFGVSPFGIWKNKKEHEDGSNTALGCSESYYNQYADSIYWIEEKIIDYIVPQIYWEFGHKIAPFADICDWWAKTILGSEVKLYIGHGAYRLGNEGEFGNAHEITNQIKYANSHNSVKGNVFFTFKNFIEQNKVKPGMDNLKALLNEVEQDENN